MTRQRCTRTSLKGYMPAGIIILALVGLSALGWTFAQPLLRMFLPLAPLALGGYLVLRTQWAR